MIIFKTGRAKKNWEKVNPLLTDVVFRMSFWLWDNYRRDLMVTESFTTEKEDKACGRVEACHREGRAVDLRNYDWTPEMIQSFNQTFHKYNTTIGAVSSSDHIRRFIVDKPHGTGSHFHLQIGRDIVTSGPI